MASPGDRYAVHADDHRGSETESYENVGGGQRSLRPDAPVDRRSDRARTAQSERRSQIPFRSDASSTSSRQARRGRRSLRGVQGNGGRILSSGLPYEG